MHYVETLKKLGPFSLKVTLRDGTERAVAVPKAGNRWARTSQVIDSLQWSNIEALDKDGRVVGVIEADEEPEMDVDDGSAAAAAMSRIMLEVMRTSMREVRSMFDVQLRGLADVTTAMAESMRASAAVYREALATQRAYLMSPPSEGDGDEAAMMRMFQMATLLGGSRASVPPSGGPKEG